MMWYAGRKPRSANCLYTRIPGGFHAREWGAVPTADACAAVKDIPAGYGVNRPPRREEPEKPRHRRLGAPDARATPAAVSWQEPNLAEEAMFQIRSMPGCALAAALLSGAPAAQTLASLPFAPGEQCVYRGTSRLGRIGTGTMAVAADSVAGERMYLLSFDFRGRVGIFGVSDRTRSWFDPRAMSSQRFTKRERSPITSRDEDVRMDGGRWRDRVRGGGAMQTDSPLDELSFIYYVRSLRLAPGESYTLSRHYDPSRNPVTVRVIGRGTITVPAGTYRTIEVEMTVVDPVRYRGTGVIQLHLTDDDRRIPVRIESAIPRVGRMVLSLESGRACEVRTVAQTE
jgi:hypothetical protein